MVRQEHGSRTVKAARHVEQLASGKNIQLFVEKASSLFHVTREAIVVSSRPGFFQPSLEAVDFKCSSSSAHVSSRFA